MPQRTVTLASLAVLFCASAWGLFWIPIRYLEKTGVDGSWTVFLLNAPAALALLIYVLLTFSEQQKHTLAKLFSSACLPGWGWPATRLAWYIQRSFAQLCYSI